MEKGTTKTTSKTTTKAASKTTSKSTAKTTTRKPRTTAKKSPATPASQLTVDVKYSPIEANMILEALHEKSQKVGMADRGQTQMVISSALNKTMLAGEKVNAALQAEAEAKEKKG